ncbi:hypothetical protein HMPREF9404_5729 [Eggerthella sp. HGA1]|nr:hypothetical protein HMPREF9404_5729 [Eggerthella sp. HGA1]
MFHVKHSGSTKAGKGRSSERMFPAVVVSERGESKGPARDDGACLRFPLAMS